MANASTQTHTEEHLRREIEELNRQRREITARIRDPRGVRRGGFPTPNADGNPRNFNPRQRGFLRPHPADTAVRKDEPAPKRRLSSAVVRVEDGEIADDTGVAPAQIHKEEGAADEAANGTLKRPGGFQPQRGAFLRRDVNYRLGKEADFQTAEPVPRVLPKNEDPKLVNRNKRMFGQLMGTLEKFRKEDMQLAGTDAYMKRSSSLQKAEERAREETERLRQEEREKIAENRKRDLVLRACLAAKAEEKKLELLFLHWSEHHKKLTKFLRTKTEPSIYYMPVKPLDEDLSLSEKKKEEDFLEWHLARREELSAYQKQMEEEYVQKELERQNNVGKNRKINIDVSLQENMDKELETHRLEHGPKRRKIPGGNNEEDDDDDVEDINGGDDDLMDDVLGVEETNQRAEEADTLKPEEGSITTTNIEQQ